MEHYRDFAENSQVPIYVKKLWNIEEEIGEFWNNDSSKNNSE